MGCNAWNHPPDCECGWGGVFYEAGGADDRHHWQNSTSYTIPNASCPVCGSKVFFYKSPFGGMVYFDDLGPPWPKHACTNSQVRRNEKDIYSISRSGAASSVYKKEVGWLPLLCRSIAIYDDQNIVLEVINHGSIPSRLYAKLNGSLINKRCPFFVRFLKGCRAYEISTLNVSALTPFELRFVAAESVFELGSILDNYQTSGDEFSFKAGDRLNSVDGTEDFSGDFSKTEFAFSKLKDIREFPGDVRSKAFDIAKREFLDRSKPGSATFLQAILSEDRGERNKYAVQELMKAWFVNKFQTIVDLLYELFPNVGAMLDEWIENPEAALRKGFPSIDGMDGLRKEKVRKNDVLRMLEVASRYEGVNIDATMMFHSFIQEVRMYEWRVREVAVQMMAVK